MTKRQKAELLKLAVEAQPVHGSGRARTQNILVMRQLAIFIEDGRRVCIGAFADRCEITDKGREEAKKLLAQLGA